MSIKVQILRMKVAPELKIERAAVVISTAEGEDILRRSGETNSQDQ